MITSGVCRCGTQVTRQHVALNREKLISAGVVTAVAAATLARCGSCTADAIRQAKRAQP